MFHRLHQSQERRKLSGWDSSVARFLSFGSRHGISFPFLINIPLACFWASKEFDLLLLLLLLLLCLDHDTYRTGLMVALVCLLGLDLVSSSYFILSW